MEMIAIAFINKNFFCKSFKVTMFFSLLIIVISNYKWLYDEYVLGQNMYSIFNKLIITDCTSNLSFFYFMFLPLLSSIPFCWEYNKMLKDKDYDVTVLDAIKNGLLSFILGIIIVFLSCIIDFLLLSLITKTEYAIPNDMTTSYNSQRFCSKLFFEYPRLFVFLWSIIISLFGGAFSFLSMSMCYIFKKVYIIYILIVFLSISNYIISLKLELIPWVNILNASYSNNNTLKLILWNVISISSLGVIIIVFRFDKIKKWSIYEKK